jgi:hypothetical protein
MLVLLLYNAVGYFLVFHIRHQIAEKEFTDYINSGDYSDEDLSLFKVPLQQYYEGSGKDFNRVEGDFEYNGKFYEKVKERLINDTIYIYCLNNEKEEQLFAQLSDHIQTHLVDSKTGKQNKKEASFKDLLKEYLPKSSIVLQGNTFTLLSSKKYNSPDLLFSSSDLSIPSPPPKIS